ncbi:MAG: hypothetical protein ACLT38_08855 [Akkermansia sp.]
MAHVLSRYQVPTTQLDRGWMNTNAVTVIDTDEPDKPHPFCWMTRMRGRPIRGAFLFPKMAENCS